MKVSRIFAGVLIVLLGVALILSNFDVVHFDWHFIFRMWPVLLVIAGISVLVSNPKWRTVLYAVTLILAVLWIVSAASTGWERVSGIFHGDGRDVQSQEFAQDLTKDVRQATLSLKGGAGKFTLNDTTADLFRGNAETNIGHYNFDSDKNGRVQNMELSFVGREGRWTFGHSTNKVDMRLNTKPAWDLNVDVGACSVDFDLTPYVVRRVTIKAGASSIKVRLGDRADTTSLKMETGVSSLKVYVPSDAGVRIDDKADLSSKTFSGFSKDADGNYVSPNYDSAKKKIFIVADAGISSIKVERY